MLETDGSWVPELGNSTCAWCGKPAVGIGEVSFTCGAPEHGVVLGRGEVTQPAPLPDDTRQCPGCGTIYTWVVTSCSCQQCEAVTGPTSGLAPVPGVNVFGYWTWKAARPGRDKMLNLLPYVMLRSGITSVSVGAGWLVVAVVFEWSPIRRTDG